MQKMPIKPPAPTSDGSGMPPIPAVGNGMTFKIHPDCFKDTPKPLEGSFSNAQNVTCVFK